MSGSSDADAIEGLLKRWFPEPAFVKAAIIGDHPLLPQEQERIARAVQRRREEFATGRWLCRQGLRGFGLPDQPIGVGRLLNPLFPETVTGTISHDGEICAVALVRRSDLAGKGIGIDLMSLRQRAGRMAKLERMFVTHPGELAVMASFGVAVEPGMLLFSLKEAAIKAMSHLLRDFIDMREVEVARDGTLALRFGGRTIDAELMAGVAGGYLVTGARTR